MGANIYLEKGDTIELKEPIPHKISFTKPPVYEAVRKAWGLDWETRGVVMVYGDTIHQSFPEKMDPDLYVHELVHVRQHTAYPGGAEAWWKRYMEDKTFRIDQELEAYRTQYKWCQENVDRNTRRAILKHCAKDLSSDLYGNVMTYDQAVDLIKQAI